MSPQEQFLWAFLGSIATLLVVADRHFANGPSLPKRFRSPGFLVNRLLLAVVAGVLSIALDPAAPIQAVYFGITAPLLVRGWMEGRIFSRPDNQD